MEQAPALRGVLLSTDDLDSALSFYTGTLGFSLSFRDGDRYAALDAGGTSVAIAATHDHPSPGDVVLTVKVARVQAAVDELAADGAEVLVAPTDGAHEVRALIRAPGGAGLLSVYGPER